MKKLWLAGLMFAALLNVYAQTDSEQLKTKKEAEIEKKVAALLSQMTLEEKIAEMTQDAPANERLGIPVMKYGEALHGLWLVLDYYGNTTVYPQAVACASTWEPELIKKWRLKQHWRLVL